MSSFSATSTANAIPHQSATTELRAAASLVTAQPRAEAASADSRAPPQAPGVVDDYFPNQTPQRLAKKKKKKKEKET